MEIFRTHQKFLPHLEKNINTALINGVFFKTNKKPPENIAPEDKIIPTLVNIVPHN